MDFETKALDKNAPTDLIPISNGNKFIGCKWICIVKYKANGSIERYKEKLVAIRYTQTYGLNYMKTFALIAKNEYTDDAIIFSN